MPWRAIIRPASRASARPSGASDTSSQPVNKPSLLCSVFPCRMITTYCRFLPSCASAPSATASGASDAASKPSASSRSYGSKPYRCIDAVRAAACAFSRAAAVARNSPRRTRSAFTRDGRSGRMGRRVPCFSSRSKRYTRGMHCGISIAARSVTGRFSIAPTSARRVLPCPTTSTERPSLRSATMSSCHTGWQRATISRIVSPSGTAIGFPSNRWYRRSFFGW
mmetsp:Transcript_44370/g.110385  ORF Transcript_44370/g.110385 Transcript_44370/m.110385 type:complete len:223 (-) Transcript_44370:499-1167(-)